MATRREGTLALLLCAICIVAGIALLTVAQESREAPLDIELVSSQAVGNAQTLASIASGTYAKQVVAADPSFFSSLHAKWEEQHTRIRSWCKSATKSKADGTKPVLYPFSGFDAMWPLACFPNSERYVMLALQPGTPSEADMNIDVTQGIRSALHGFVKHGYFTTVEQNGAKIDASRFLAVVLKVLYRADFQTVEVCPNTLPSDGCVLMRFKRQEAAVSQEIMYWSGQVLDNEAFYTYIQTLPQFYSFFKATEYSVQAKACGPTGIPDQNKYLFHRLITIVRERSQVVIQDDSGIPFKFLNEAPFQVEIFGAYEGPPYLTDSCTFYQPDLANEYFRVHNHGGVPPLPVQAFGYYVHRNCLLGEALAGKLPKLAGNDLQLPALMSHNFPNQKDEEFCMWSESSTKNGKPALTLSPKCHSSTDIIPGPDTARCRFSPMVSSVGIVAVR